MWGFNYSHKHLCKVIRNLSKIIIIFQKNFVYLPYIKNKTTNNNHIMIHYLALHASLLTRVILLYYFFANIQVSSVSAQSAPGTQGSTQPQQTETNYIKGQLLLQVYEGVSVEQVAERAQYIDGIATNVAVLRQLSRNNRIWLLSFNEDNIAIDKMIGAVSRDRGVSIVQKNHLIQWRATPNDPLLAQQWQYINNGSGGVADADIDAELAWDYTTGGLTATGDTIVVAVVDDGIDMNHPDLIPNIWNNPNEIPNNAIDDDGNGFTDDYNGWNFQNNNKNIGNGSHGVEVSGVVGAKGNNAAGVTGVNWNVKLMTVVNGSISGAQGEANVIAAYSYVLNMRKKYNETNGQKGAFAVATNSSWGIDYGQPANAPLWCAFYDSLGKYGILSAGATANINLDVDVKGDLPTACPSDFMIAVTNTTKSDLLNTGAAYGDTTIDIGAPGTSVYTTFPTAFGSPYGSTTGTSFSSPHIAGTVGLLYSLPCPAFMQWAKQYPDSAARMIKQFILNGTDTITSLKNKTVTGGRLNLHNSVLLFNQYCASLTGTGIDEPTAGKFSITGIYPNPVTGNLRIRLSSAQNTSISVSLQNVLGETVYTRNISDNSSPLHEYSMSVKDVPDGIYFLTVEQNGERTEARKVAVMR